jgi:copper transport protein
MNGSYPTLDGSVAVSFDEPVTILNSDALEVDDDSGRRVDRRDAHVDPEDATRVVVDVPKDLESGFYTVRWRVISTDTHVVHGDYQIGVGIQLNAIKRSDERSAFDPAGLLASAIRWLSLLGALLAVGAFALSRLLLRKLEPPSPEADAVARRAAVAGAVLVILMDIPALLVQAAAVSGHLGWAILPTLLSRWGIAWIVRLMSVLVFLLVVALWWRRGAVVASLAACGLLTGFSASGHALALSGIAGVVAFVMDFAHLVASSIWIGGVMVLAPIVFAQRTLAAALFARFTPLAIASVAAIAVTGTYAAIVHVGTFADLIHTAYGRILLIKVAFVAVLLLFGYRHLRIGYGRAAVAGADTIGYEALVGVAVVALTALLIGQMLPMHMPGMSTALLAPWGR